MAILTNVTSLHHLLFVFAGLLAFHLVPLIAASSLRSYHQRSQPVPLLSQFNTADDKAPLSKSKVPHVHGFTDHSSVPTQSSQAEDLHSSLDSLRNRTKSLSKIKIAANAYHKSPTPNYSIRKSSHRPDYDPKILREELSTPRNVSWDSLSSRNEVVAFYNLYLGSKDVYPAIVKEQVNLMDMTGLLFRLDKIYYVTIGAASDSMPTHIRTLLRNTTMSARGRETKRRTESLFYELRNTVRAVDETLTLTDLFDFCDSHPHSTVLYFHNKGSYHYSADNVYFRHFLDCYVLNTHCLDALTDSHTERVFDTCGWRLSPLPSPHYSGNFWWARCAYVKKLVHPASMALNDTFATQSKLLLSKAVVSHDRYFAEAWVSSHPDIRPADCMAHTVDTSFFCCYDLAAVSVRQCPNHAKHWVPGIVDSVNISNYEAVLQPLIKKKLQASVRRARSAKGIVDARLEIGSQCGAADVFANGEFYAKTYADKRAELDHAFGVNMVDELRLRTMIWYGQEPWTVLNATEHLETLPALPQEALICDRFEPSQCHYLLRGVLYAATSMEYKMAAAAYGGLDRLEKVSLAAFQIKKLQRMKTIV